LFNAHDRQDRAEAWNVQVTDKVVTPQTRRGIGIGHAVR
jgi:hypothetical protein